MSDPTLLDGDDDQHWLDLMAGRAAPEADARTRQEAAWLRAALLSYRVTAPPGAPAAADERAERLLARAREAGVIPAAPLPTPDAHPGTHRWRWRWPANEWRASLVAGVLAVGILVMMRTDQLLRELPSESPAPATSTSRGAPLQHLEAQDPAQRRAQLLEALRAEGFDAQPFERLGRLGIDIALPVPLPAAQAAALTRLGLQPPAGPSLQIEILALPATRP